MKSSFSRSFSTAAAILLIALTVLGASFQLQVNKYLTESTVSALQQDADVIASLAAAYSSDSNLTSRDFLLNLDVVSRVTDADMVICDSEGTILLCSEALMGCDHNGVSFNRDYVQQVISQGGSSATGVINGLYQEERFIVAKPINPENADSGVVSQRQDTSQ